MALASFADHGWIGFTLLLVFLLRQQIKMLAMRFVFLIYRTSRKDQNRWLIVEASRNDKITLARDFWNREFGRRFSRTPRCIVPPPLAEPEKQADLSMDTREPRLPAA